MFKSIKFKRIAVYFLDIIIVTLISSMFASIDILNPYLEKQNDLTKEYNQIIEKYSTGSENINDLLNNEFILDYNYNLAKYGMYTTIITLVITFLYFVIFQYYNKGRTIGKALLDIMVVDNELKRVSFLKVLFRSLIINSIITNGILVLSVIFLNKNKFIAVSEIVSVVEMGLIITCIILFIFRNDGKLVHDYIAGTKVILSDEYNDENKINKSKKVKVRKSDK